MKSHRYNAKFAPFPLCLVQKLRKTIKIPFQDEEVLKNSKFCKKPIQMSEQGGKNHTNV